MIEGNFLLNLTNYLKKICLQTDIKKNVSLVQRNFSQYRCDRDKYLDHNRENNFSSAKAAIKHSRAQEKHTEVKNLFALIINNYCY